MPKYTERERAEIFQEHAIFLASALRNLLKTYAPNADKTVAESGEESLHSAVREARAVLRQWDSLR